MKVLIADKFEESGVEELRAAGCDVTHDPELSGDSLTAAIKQTRCRLLIVRGTRVTEAALTASDELGVVVRAGAGYNTIDLVAASRRSVLVANCPGKNAVAVAELTFALILGLDRLVVENVTDLREGCWNKKRYAKARGLKGRTLGVVGLGTIGCAVVQRAAAFEMNIVAWSRSLTAEKAERLGLIACASPAEVASRCDILTIHLAAAPETKGLIDADVLNRLKAGAYVINTARADVMDYEALAVAAGERDLRVGLDVYPDEPATGEARFRCAIAHSGPIVYGTHHIGASTDQAQEAIAAETVRIVKAYMSTGRVENCVNLCQRSAARYVLVVRHRNRPGVLAYTLHAISHAGVNVEEMENVICEGAESASAQIKLDAPLDDALLREIRDGNEHIFAVSFASIDDRSDADMP
ncbi:MAG: hydroxyacid dehydrogenase [Planctomycetes bacterium]|nr:hydroxyacid dehydrogenase [Planctomycetota bacterium]